MIGRVAHVFKRGVAVGKFLTGAVVNQVQVLQNDHTDQGGVAIGFDDSVEHTAAPGQK